MKTIAQKTFRFRDVDWFGSVSGDRNPLHVDYIYARRNITGEIAVHGVYILLWTLNEICAERRNCKTLNFSLHSLVAYFQYPVALERAVELHVSGPLDGETLRIDVVQSGTVTTTIQLQFCHDKHPEIDILIPRPAAEIAAPSFDGIKDLSGEESLYGDPTQLGSTFSDGLKAFGQAGICSLLAISRIIGMSCPGMNSLLSRIEVSASPDYAKNTLAWRVIRHTIPLAPIKLDVSGGGISGSVEAFYRPVSATQPSMKEICNDVAPNEFDGQRALVVGGSRGLGELVAKNIAAGGGNVCITYQLGADDAQRVCKEIALARSGSCQLVQLDTHSPNSGVQHLKIIGFVPSHVYFFASPRIRLNRSEAFDNSLYSSYASVYVFGFANLIELLYSFCPDAFRVFYPSTVYLERVPKGLREYVAAKAAGEAICDGLESSLNGLRIMKDRLPPLYTDQNVGIISVRTVDAILEIRRALHAFKELGENSSE